MEEKNPMPNVFVLMPFREEFSDIYEFGIKPACREAGAYCSRLDEQIFTESILERLFNQITKADIVLADMSGRNPNVFFEVGYACALNKKVILLAQDQTDIPFDLKMYPHIIYSGKISTLRHQLEGRIRANVEIIKDSIRSIDQQSLTTSDKHDLLDEERGFSYTQLTDEQLLQRIGTHRDNIAFDIFYERIYPAIVRHVRSAFTEENLSSNEELLKDVVGRILVELWVQAEKFNPDEITFENWLAYLIRGCIHDMLYKQPNKYSQEVLLSNIPYDLKKLIDDARKAAFESPLIPAAAAKTLASAFQDFSPSEKKIFQLWVEGHTSSEIASILGMTPSSIRQRLARTKGKLRNRLVHKESS